MKIINETKKTVIAEKTEIARSFWRKALGLMLRSGMDDSAGFLLEFEKEGTYGIWMLGMRFPIDLVFIDSRKRVVDIFKGIKPFGFDPTSWKVYNPGKTTKWVLELKSGRVRETMTSVGDMISFHKIFIK